MKPTKWIAPTKSATSAGFARWDVVASSGDYIVPVAKILHHEDLAVGERQEIAHLVSSAPDLLEALELFIDNAHECDVGGGDVVVTICEALEKARSAVKKARGEN